MKNKNQNYQEIERLEQDIRNLDCWLKDPKNLYFVEGLKQQRKHQKRLLNELKN